MSLKLKVDLSAFKLEMDALNQSVMDAAHPAAQAMAQVLYENVQGNVAKLGTKSGNLARSIYQVFSKENSGPGQDTFHVSWNAKKAPHGHLLEFGYIQRYRVYFKNGKWYTDKKHPLPPKQIAAHPFVRPAIAKFPQAQAAGEAEFLRRIGLTP